METKEKRALIILGMHRSGISALGGCIDRLGLNPEGRSPEGRGDEYSCHEAIMVQHEIMLRNMGCRWDMVGNLPRGWHRGGAAKDAGEKISAIIDRCLSENRLLVVGDPRMCRLMPLWTDILAEKRIRPCFVLLVRHPYEVARSLEKQEGFDLLKGHLLWLVHNREALAAVSGRDYVIITYDALLADPVHCMEKISRRLDITFDRPPRQAHSRLIGFVRSDLKHHYGGSLENADKRFSRYEWLYDQLRMNQGPALADSENRTSLIEKKQMDMEINGFPLVTAPGTGGYIANKAYVAEMLDDVMAVLSDYEQKEVDSEARREKRLLEADQKDGVLYARVYFPGVPGQESGYTTENSRQVLLAPDVWQKISVFIADPDILRCGRLRIDPLNSRGTVNISSVNLVHPANGEVIWSAFDGSGFSQCAIEGQAIVAPDSETSMVYFATGGDARILLPMIPNLPELPLNLDIWIRVTRSLKDLNDAWAGQEKRIGALTGQAAEAAEKLEACQRACDETVSGLESELTEARQSLALKDEALDECRIRQEADEKRLQELSQNVAEQDERIARYYSAISESERRFSELHAWFARLAELLGFDETTASSSVHLVKKSSKVFSRKAPIDEIQTVFRNFYAMMPEIDASVAAEEEKR